MRSFKRNYRWAGDALRRLHVYGGISLKGGFADGVANSHLIVPDENAAAQFAVIMRHFLAPSDPLYLRAMLAWLRSRYGNEALSDDEATSVTRSLEQLAEGVIGIEVNGHHLSAEQVYDLVARGEFFGADPEAETYLGALRDIPLIRTLFWFQFYSFAQDCYAVLGRLFDTIRRAEDVERLRSTLVEPRPPAQCIYCLSTRGTFASEEHIFPEALGNDAIVLPRGYVCDRCNNGVLSQLDAALLSFGPVALLRVLYVPHGKSGKLPTARFKNLTVAKTRPNHILFRSVLDDDHELISDQREIGGGWQSFRLNVVADQFDPPLLARALFKVALGLVALDHGVSAATAPRYQAAREFVLGHRGFTNNLVVVTDANPEQTVIAQYVPGETGTAVAMSIFGIRFLFNLEEEPVVDASTVPAGVNVEVVPLDSTTPRAKLTKKANRRQARAAPTDGKRTRVQQFDAPRSSRSVPPQ